MSAELEDGPEAHSDPLRPKVEELVKKALNDLAEHFDAVAIFGCYTDGDDSVRYYKGRGNRYTRYGMIKDWVNQMDRE